MGKKAEGTSTSWRQRLGLTKEETQNQFLGRRDDLIILFMGPIGVGKSTFIQEYTANQTVVVGHQLESCTRAVTWYEAQLPAGHSSRNGRLILVDTPGFDDTFSDNSEILRRVSVWLAQSYNCDAPIAGIVYMYDITQKRMFGSTRMNLNMFTRLCGNESLKRVVLATSQWDLPKFPGKVGEEREEELKGSFWADVVKEGAKVMSIKQKPDDQLAIILYLLENHVKHLDQKMEAEYLQIQKEIVDLGTSIPATEAGQELKTTLEELQKLQKKDMKNKLDEEEKEELRNKQKQLKDQIRALKLSPGERITKFFGLL